jgi:hypothetical protein
MYIDRNFALDHQYVNRKGMLKVTDAFPLDPKQERQCEVCQLMPLYLALKTEGRLHFQRIHFVS